MDKYTIDMESHFEDGWIVEKNGEFEAEFKTQEKAKDYIDWKNQKKIDKNIKEMLINFIKYVAPCDIVQSKKAIEILENLPSEEN